MSLIYRTFAVVIEKKPDEQRYAAYSPTLAGCFSTGSTIEEARRTIREAIQRRVEALLASGEPVPQGEHLVHVEELTVALPALQRKEPV